VGVAFTPVKQGAVAAAFLDPTQASLPLRVFTLLSSFTLGKQSMDLFELILNGAGFATSVAEDEVQQPTSSQEEPSLGMLYCVIA